MDLSILEFQKKFPVRVLFRICLYSILTSLSVSNGAILMPNTFGMQEWIRTSFDHYVEGLEDGKPPADPVVLRVPKGLQSAGCQSAG